MSRTGGSRRLALERDPRDAIFFMFASAAVPACLASNAVSCPTCSRVSFQSNPGRLPAGRWCPRVLHHLPESLEASVPLAVKFKRGGREIGEQAEFVALRQDHFTGAGFLRQNFPRRRAFLRHRRHQCAGYFGSRVMAGESAHAFAARGSESQTAPRANGPSSRHQLIIGYDRRIRKLSCCLAAGIAQPYRGAQS